eukprot:5872022-Pleurochrysis_carterae.AAC.1
MDEDDDTMRAPIDTDWDGDDNAAPAAAEEGSIAFRVRRRVWRTAHRTMPTYAISVDMSEALEPEPPQANLPMQSDPGAPTSFKDIANIANVDERNE